MSDKESFVQVV